MSASSTFKVEEMHHYFTGYFSTNLFNEFQRIVLAIKTISTEIFTTAAAVIVHRVRISLGRNPESESRHFPRIVRFRFFGQSPSNDVSFLLFFFFGFRLLSFSHLSLLGFLPLATLAGLLFASALSFFLAVGLNKFCVD
jgi:hypothetical protein